MENSNRWLDEISGNLEDLKDYISEGEHITQDFKFRIDSARKIAITLCAFANTEGGRILIGVKDNGRISGIDPEEEFYMIDGAANMYCKPPVPFSSRVYEDEDRKKVLEIIIASSEKKPHFCQSPDDERWNAYIRQTDQNFRINRVILKLLKDRNPASVSKNLISYGPEERQLFDYLSLYDDISLSKFSRISGLSIPDAENILVNFLKWGVIEFHCSDKGVRFSLNSDPDL